MAQSKETNEEQIEFSWGKKRGVGAKKGIQFYESFVFDGMEYHLYDCVYLFKDDVTEPFIGKIVKIWEQPVNKRRVKILWFFRPGEIATYLGDGGFHKNELFLASGEGPGLFNVNPLEAVAGKCHVICTAKDERNPQPSQEELKMADFIFYQTFNVGNYTVSDKIDDTIAGVEARFLFNNKDHMAATLCKIKLVNNDGSDTSDKIAKVTAGDLVLNVSLIPKMETNLGIKEILQSDQTGVHSDSCNEKPKNMRRCDNMSQSTDNIKKAKVSVSQKVGPNDVKVDTAVKTPNDQSKLKKAVDSKGMGKGSEDLKLPEKGIKLSAGPTKRKVSELPEDAKETSLVVKASQGQSKVKTMVDSNGMKKESGNLKLVEKRMKLSDGTAKKEPPDLSEDINKISDIHPVEVTRRPEVDRSKWFADVPWDVKMENACDQDRLVLLDNLDPDYSQEEIEDMMYHAFKQNCSVRLIEQSSFTNPNYGQAAVIFKSQEIADLVVQKLDKEVLMLPSGRPLIASKGLPRPAGKKSSALFGPLSVDKYTKLKKIREDLRKASSASHYSAANTIEYEMAVEWMLLDTKSRHWWKELHKEQLQEIKQITRSLKSK